MAKTVNKNITEEETKMINKTYGKMLSPLMAKKRILKTLDIPFYTLCVSNKIFFI